MLELVRKSILLGIGLASMTKDKIEELANKIAEEDNLSAEEGRKLAEDLLKQSDEARKNLKGQVQRFVKNTLENLDIPSHKDLQELEGRLKKLEELQQKQSSST